MHSFCTALLERHVGSCFEINYKQMIKIPFIIHSNFESITRINGKLNPEDFYRSKYQNQVGCSYVYKLVSADNYFSKTRKSYLREDVVHKFITIMVKEKKCCSSLIKKHFNRKLVLTKEDDENFESFTKCWICDNTLFEDDVKL